jgi:hypothetical protein
LVEVVTNLLLVRDGGLEGTDGPTHFSGFITGYAYRFINSAGWRGISGNATVGGLCHPVTARIPALKREVLRLLTP